LKAYAKRTFLAIEWCARGPQKALHPTNDVCSMSKIVINGFALNDDADSLTMKKIPISRQAHKAE
jgi:hypothetical protein